MWSGIHMAPAFTSLRHHLELCRFWTLTGHRDRCRRSRHRFRRNCIARHLSRGAALQGNLYRCRGAAHLVCNFRNPNGQEPQTVWCAQESIVRQRDWMLAGSVVCRRDQPAFARDRLGKIWNARFSFSHAARSSRNNVRRTLPELSRRPTVTVSKLSGCL